MLVGIVEKMSSSLKLLEFILDGTHQVPSLFQFFLSGEQLAKVTNLASKNLTGEIVERISNDDLLLARLREHLKYELLIYEHALMIHLKQNEWVENHMKDTETS